MMEFEMFDPLDWFWIVGGDETRAWSSVVGAYVSEWPQGRVTRIHSEEELSDVLRKYGCGVPRPVGADVAEERARRLALGFDYDFGDVRGVHRIGTTDGDMKGWREVTDSAQAAIALGNGSQPLTVIVTDTGPAEVTAAEWMAVLDAARLARQPIWSASFALQAMDPIPVDYEDDTHWPT